MALPPSPGRCVPPVCRCWVRRHGHVLHIAEGMEYATRATGRVKFKVKVVRPVVCLQISSRGGSCLACKQAGSCTFPHPPAWDPSPHPPVNNLPHTHLCNLSPHPPV